ncbi:hypothetical protein SDC9_196320 [bioreactor metagenome]|uniref:Uncharacterized protein n=1 Tax=bioreactor metagenome TaxID=1076179 RepID=A0A645IBP5_9ZZZZ
MVGEVNGLGPLQMGVTRHNDIGIFLGCLHKGFLEIQQQPGDVGQFLADIQMGVDRHLVVAAPRRVQFTANRTNTLGQTFLDIHMNIFQSNFKAEITGFDIGQDVFQSFDDQFGLVSGNNAAFGQHPGVGNTAGHVFPVHPAVKRNGGGKLLHHHVSVLGKSAAPQLTHWFSSPLSA